MVLSQQVLKIITTGVLKWFCMYHVAINDCFCVCVCVCVCVRAYVRWGSVHQCHRRAGQGCQTAVGRDTILHWWVPIAMNRCNISETNSCLLCEWQHFIHFILTPAFVSSYDIQYPIHCNNSLYWLVIQSNLSTTAKHGDKRVGLCREFDLISEFFR